MVRLEVRGRVKNRARLLIGDGDVFILHLPLRQSRP